jgi:hypothetical protein
MHARSSSSEPREAGHACATSLSRADIEAGMRRFVIRRAETHDAEGIAR